MNSTSKCAESNGSYACVRPAGHTGLHLTEHAGCTPDGRMYIVGFRRRGARNVRHYVR